MNFFKKVREFFGGKPKERGLIIQPGLPVIDARAPLVAPPLQRVAVTKQTYEEEEKILKSCAVCRFAKHDENLNDLMSVVCTLDPNKPDIKLADDTCLSMESKYPKLKVIVDKGTLLEYDSERANSRTPKGFNTGSTSGITEVGEDQW